MVKYPSLWGVVKWHHVALWTQSLGFESLLPSLRLPRLREFLLEFEFPPHLLASKEVYGSIY